MIRPPKSQAGDDMSAQTTSGSAAGSAPEIIEVTSTRVMCEGSGGALGHPRVYLEMGDKDFVECGYCDRRYVLRAGTERH
jgi:uncharacterized Zn-finger protein